MTMNNFSPTSHSKCGVIFPGDLSAFVHRELSAWFRYRKLPELLLATDCFS